MSHSYDQGTPNGIAQHKPRRKSPHGGLVSLGQPGHVRFEPPCRHCKLPMLPGEKACPRCHVERELAA